MYKDITNKRTFIANFIRRKEIVGLTETKKEYSGFETITEYIRLLRCIQWPTSGNILKEKLRTYLESTDENIIEVNFKRKL